MSNARGFSSAQTRQIVTGKPPANPGIVRSLFIAADVNSPLG
jgi:hypothetical protein